MNEQFDEFPIDRPVILKRLYQLFNCLADRRVLDFRFFAGRFDAIVAELKESDHFRSSFKKRSSTTATAMASEAVATSQSAVPAHTSLRTRLSRQVSCHHLFGPNPVNLRNAQRCEPDVDQICTHIALVVAGKFFAEVVDVPGST